MAYCVGGSQKLIDHEPIGRTNERCERGETGWTERRGTNAVTITSVFLNENRPSSRLVRGGGTPFSR